MILGQLCLEAMKLESLTKIIQPIRVYGDVGLDVKAIHYDSRQVRPGTLFVALPGLHRDGADYIDDAIRRGACAVVSQLEDFDDENICHIYVEDARRALAEIACAFYGHPSSKLQSIGITGTNGKTTTAFMSRSIMAAAGRRPGLIGTVQYEIGARHIPAGRTTPEAVDLQSMMDQMVQSNCKSVVMEVSSHALDQRRVWGTDFDVGVFTNLSQDHLDYHNSMQDYFNAKSRLFRGLGQGEKKAAAVINIDSSWGMQLAAINGFRVQAITYGLHPAADVRAENVEMNRGGSSFTLHTLWGNADVTLPMPGDFNISNALAAAAACGSLGVDVSLIADVLSSLDPVPGRLQPVLNDRDLDVYVDYAHTPDALNNVLNTLREITEQRILLVFGCGGDRDQGKRALMGRTAAQLADYSVITNDNPRTEDPNRIAADIEAGFGSYQNFETILDRKRAIARAVQLAAPGDTILIAGKGHEQFQDFGKTVVAFDDVEAVSSCMAG